MWLKTLRTASAMALFVLLSLNSFSQKTQQQKDALRQKVFQDQKVADVVISDERETPSIITFRQTTTPYSAAEVPTLLRNYLSLRPGYDDLLKVRETTLFNQLSVPEFQQYFKGIKVEYSRYKALVKNNDVSFLGGSFYEIPETISLSPALTEAQALELAKKQVGARKWAWDDLEEKIASAPTSQVKAILQNELKELLPKGEVVIVKDFTKKDVVDMRLAYKFNLYASEPLSRGYIYIDAQTGKTLLYNAIIKHASVETTVATRYAGNRKIRVKQISGNDPNSGTPIVSSHPTTEPTYIPGSPTYVLIDDTRGGGIETYDLNNVGGLPLSVGALYAQGKSLTDVDNNWTLAEHKRSALEGGAAEAENDDIAWDAHWGAEMVYDYWKAKHNRLSFDNKNSKIKSYIHYGPAYDNAFWNGSVMTYGDGSGTAATGFKALTSLDVCGHEIGHGVCSNTSDLVYEKESGAMNEGFSDIWAACVENFAIKNVDATLATRYKPFYIGEQISYTALPLRTMDNPKATSNPDTYGGQYWQNPDCVPNLANDECGVHTNSNVLNKWFYLITCGSGTGSGPDQSYVIPGADDGVNDKGQAYSVTGLGFNITEQVAFITETMLSSTATYAEARQMSIAAASAYSGDPCGSIVQTITNAWYAVGVGNAFTAPCTVTYGFVYSNAINTSEGLKGAGCNGVDSVIVPILIPANSTVAITTSGTATNGVDYKLSTTSMSNNTGTNRQDSLYVIIYNDAVVETTESVVVNLNISNLGTSPSNASFTINIADDDVTPRIGSDTLTLISENFDSAPTGFTAPVGWAEQLETPEDPALDPQATGKNHWGVFTNTTGKGLAVTGRLGSDGTGTLAPGTYYNTSTSRTRMVAPQIDGRALTDLRIKFDYTVQGEVDPNGADPEVFPKLDYLALAYSYDGVNYKELGNEYRFASAVPISGTFDEALPSFLNNKQFYVAFIWNNDPLAGGPVSATVDNVVLKALPRRIETVLNASGNELVNGQQEVYFYSQQNGKIIAKVNSSANVNYGCVTTAVEKAGTSSFTLYSENGTSHKVADKVVRITPTTNSTGNAYSVTLYLTQQEIQALTDATLKPRTSLYIYKTEAANFASASAANTTRQAATYTDIPGVGGYFTATFSTGFSAFTVGADVTSALPVTCIDFNAIKNTAGVQLAWKIGAEVNNKNFEVERSSDGFQFTSIGTVKANSSNAGNYNFIDNTIIGLKEAYYRLKQTDQNGEVHYVCNVVRVKLDGKNSFGISPIYPNPAKGNSFVKITSGEKMRVRIELIGATGQILNSRIEILQEGSNILPLKITSLSSGTYMLRFRSEKGEVLGSQVFVKE